METLRVLDGPVRFPRALDVDDPGSWEWCI